MQPVSKQQVSELVPTETRRTLQYGYNGNGGVFCWVRLEVL
jgi:hypothetical protein